MKILNIKQCETKHKTTIQDSLSTSQIVTTLPNLAQAFARAAVSDRSAESFIYEALNDMEIIMKEDSSKVAISEENNKNTQ